MNPSKADWIPKFLNHFERQELIEDFQDENSFYKALKSVGFIYGVSVMAIPDEQIKTSNLHVMN